MYAAVISGGTVVTPDGARAADIAIADGRIVRIADPGSAPDAERRIDASGLLVVPGGIDAHVHAAPMGLGADEEADSTDGAALMSRAALLGGTTTLIDFARPSAGSLAAGLERRIRHWRDAACDHAFHILLRSDLDERQLDEIPTLVRAGHPSFKIFTTSGLPSRRSPLYVNTSAALAALTRIAAAGGILTVHGEDEDLVRAGYEAAEREGRTALSEMPVVRSALAEEVAFRRTITLARHVDGAAVYFMHVTGRDGVAAITEARSRGQSVYGETLHNYLVFDASYYDRPDGPLYHTYPSLRSTSHRDAIADGLVLGDLSAVSTDGALGSRARKLEGRTLLDVRGGHAGVQARLAVAYTELVEKRGVSVEAFVQRTATAPARIFGLYPRKGAIVEGADADLVLLEPGRRTLRAAELIEADYSVWDGYEASVHPRVVLLRGIVAVEHGALTAQSRGRLVGERRIDDAIRAGPAV